VDYQERVSYCNRFINYVHDGLMSLNWHFSQMRLILMSRDILSHKTTGTGVVKFLMR
jgi:hypothetical protein